MSLLVLGADGQLGRQLRLIMPEAVFWTRNDLDLSITTAIKPALERLMPAGIVNASAYTAVDEAERQSDMAWRLNAEAPAEFARFAHAAGIPLVHISTDYVFDGESRRPYTESDRVRPLNVYGRSKLSGELAVSSLCPHAWTLRTSWVFGEHGANFVRTMLRLAKERSEIRVVDDQRGIPTYAGHLAMAVSHLLRTGMTASPGLEGGVYHVTGGDAVSWRQFAEEIFQKAVEAKLIARAPTVVPITSREFPSLAERPKKSVLQPHSFFTRSMPTPIDWQRGLTTTLERLAQSP